MLYVSRLKKIQEKKKKIVKEKELLRLKRKQEGLEMEASRSLLEEGRDEDLLF